MAGNLWRRFEALVKPAGEEIVAVIGKHADGTVTGQTIGGETIRVRCSFEVEAGEKVFVAAGEARAKAPNLPYYELEI